MYIIATDVEVLIMLRTLKSVVAIIVATGRIWITTPFPIPKDEWHF